MTDTVARPRVLFVDHAGVLGGAELSLLDVIDAWRDRCAVTLLADGPFRLELERRGVPVEVEPLGALGDVRKATRVPSPGALVDLARVARRIARRARAFDVVYANSQKAFVTSAAASIGARSRLVWHLRDILGPPHFSAMNSRGAAWVANRRAAVVIANSRATGDAFVAAGGRASLVRVVHNGIDPAPFDAVTEAGTARVRAELGAPAGAPVVAHVGRFHPWKGQDVLIRALAGVPEVRAWIVGAPLFGEQRYEDDLKRLAASLGVADRVVFTGFRNDVPTLLCAADVIVHSSVYPEPFGRVVVEGMLAGRPVIAARAGGIPEIAADGDTALLVPPGDAAALTGALATLLRSPDLRARLASRGRAHARAKFSRDAMVRGVEDAISSVA